MAIEFQRTNPYTTPQTYQLRREDFFELTDPFTISGNIVDVEKEEIYQGKIYIADGIIQEIKRCPVSETHYILPGLIDAHVHIESSMLTPANFAAEAVKHGVLAAVADPHEIVNVMGIPGLDYMISNGKSCGFKFFFGLPSCVPATDFDAAGAVFDVSAIEQLIQSPDIYFLAEMMDYPGVIHRHPEVWAKLAAAKKYHKPIDGHAPNIFGEELKQYIAAGITTDHECIDICEAEEKINLGMKIIIREGSAAKNFDILYPLINRYPSMTMLCTDDCHPADLEAGYLLRTFKKGLDKGLNFFNLLKTTSINPINHYHLPVGLLKKGDPADCIIVDNLSNLSVKQTYIAGNLVYDAPKSFIKNINNSLINNFHALSIDKNQIEVKAENKKIRVIELINNDLYTKQLVIEPSVKDGLLVQDLSRDILKILVLNRYSPNKPPAIGFVKGFGLQRGALCSTVSHDSHNIIAVGTDDFSLLQVVNAVIGASGGLAVSDACSLDILPLPVAGLMSSTSASEMAVLYDALQQKAISLGCPLTAPFMTLAFLSLIVIPELKIFDRGLFDVNRFMPVSLFVD